MVTDHHASGTFTHLGTSSAIRRAITLVGVAGLMRAVSA
jgi:hypothetical protein